MNFIISLDKSYDDFLIKSGCKKINSTLINGNKCNVFSICKNLKFDTLDKSKTLFTNRLTF